MSTSQTPAQDTSTARDRRRKRKERSAASLMPEPKNIVSGAGQPLDLSVRRDLEEQLGHDLSQVRLHTDRASGALAELMGADAFAVGQDIFFREGAFAPGTSEGQRLLAHELLHTVQNPHGLGTLRAGRDLGAVSLPQEAIEREAEGAARDLVRPTAESAENAAPAVEAGQATPGWLRYATVDPDRRRMEQLDPATLVDRMANGLLRSLRGDPEDRSGRVRLQLARMAPQVQEIVLDRLELRLPTPVVDRLLELVEETEQAGPLPLKAGAAPQAVPDAAEDVEQERQPATGKELRAERGTENGPRTRADHLESGRANERGGAIDEVWRTAPEGSGNADRTGQDAQDQSDVRESEEPGARHQDRSRNQQQDRQAQGQDAQKDVADERRDVADTQKEQQDQDQRSEQAAQQEAGDPDDEAAEEPERDAGEQEPQQTERTDAAQVARRPAAVPAAVDRSWAEPGEVSRTGEDPGADRTVGDPENEEDADDAPLGLEAEPAEDDAKPEPGISERTDGTAASGDDSQQSGDETVDDPRLFVRRKRGAPRAPDLTFSDGPLVPGESQYSAAAEPTPDTLARTTESDSADQAIQDLVNPTSPSQDSTAEGGGAAFGELSPGGAAAGAFSTVTGVQRLQERQRDAEAAQRDEAARNDDGAGPDTVLPPVTEAGPKKLTAADEDARTQSADSLSGTPGTSAGSNRADTTTATASPSDQTGAETSTDSGKATNPKVGPSRGTDRPDNTMGRDDSSAGGRSDAEYVPTPPSPDVTPGTGHATSPDARTGPDEVSSPGPAGTPNLDPGSGVSPVSPVAKARTSTPEAPISGRSGAADGPAGSSPRSTGSKRQPARPATRTVRKGGGGSARSASAPTPLRSGGHSAGRGTPAGGAKARKKAPAPDVSHATPEAGLATAAGLKPHQALQTLRGVDGAVGRSVDKERTTLRKAPPTRQRPSGSPRTVPGGPRAAAPGMYTKAKVARTNAAQGKTPEITGEQKPKGEVPGGDVPEPSWWDIGVTIGVQLLGKVLKELLPLDDLIDSILSLPTKDEGLNNARVGDAPGLPLQDDSDPQRTGEQSGKLDERKSELHRSGREDAAQNMGEDQIYPDVPKETLTGKVPGGKRTMQKGSARSVSGGVPIESASAVAEHDRGPQIQAGFSEGRQKMGKERQAKDKKATDDRRQHDEDLQREVSASSRKQSDARTKGRSDITDSRDRWRKEQDDTAAEIDDKKGKKYDKIRKDIDDKQEQTDKDVDRRTQDDNQKIEDEQTGAEQEADKKKQDSKDDADNWLEEAIEKLKDFFNELKNAIKSIFEKARRAVTDLIDQFKQQVFKLIDDARNWVVDQINQFADTLIALGDELLADYPAMRDKWRTTINEARDWAVQKVNEAADALKEVAGKLLDGLSGALLAGLDLLETGLLAAVDVAESVTVGALEFGAAAVAALGEWAAIFNDIVSDPGDWISKAGAAAETGAKEHLFNETKTAVRAWFNQKVQEIIGIPPEDFQALLDGGVTVDQMAKMAWDETLPQLPVIIGVLVVEKVVAKLIPGAGWVMAIIDALQTAWGALSEILAAFGLFMDFLKSVKSGNGALPFAKAVAAGVVALLELVYQLLIEGIGRFMGKVADRLGDLLKKIIGKKKPGGSKASEPPGTPNKPKDDKPKDSDAPRSNDDRVPSSDGPANRPPARKPSPDRMSRPPSKPRPGKRPSPEKKSRPVHTTRPKKRRDDHERREEGHEVNAARRRARDAQHRIRDEDQDGHIGAPARRGPGRDTVHPDRRRHRPDDRDHNPKGTPPDGRRSTDDRSRPNEGGRTDDRRLDADADRGRDRDRGTRDRPRRIRRARQTVKSAVSRARRAARRLYGKARRKFGNHLNDRLRHLLDLLRRREDRARDDRSRQPNRDRSEQHDYSDITMPKVRYTDADDGERHTLTFHGAGSRAPLYIHSAPIEVPPFLTDWQADLGRKEAKADKEKQQKFLTNAQDRHADIEKIAARKLTKTDKKERKTEKNAKKYALSVAMKRFANEARNRLYFDIPEPKIGPFSDLTINESQKEKRLPENHESKWLGTSTKTVFGGGGQEAGEASDGQPPGWDEIVDEGLSAGTRWVRMHLQPERLGGKAKGNNLVPARTQTNSAFRDGIELKAYDTINKNTLIWYKSGAQFSHADWPYVPSSIYAEYGTYEKTGGTGKEHEDWTNNEDGKKFERPHPAPAPDEKSLLLINQIGRPTIKARLLGGEHETLARQLAAAIKELPEGQKLTKAGGKAQIRRVLKEYCKKHGVTMGKGIEVLLKEYEEIEGKVDWSEG